MKKLDSTTGFIEKHPEIYREQASEITVALIDLSILKPYFLQQLILNDSTLLREMVNEKLGELIAFKIA